MKARYSIRPKADEDLEQQALYFATRASPETGHRFLVAAHETFTLLATRPNIGWHPRLQMPELASLRVFPVSGFRRMLIFYNPTEQGVEVLRVVHGSRDLLRVLLREGAD